MYTHNLLIGQNEQPANANPCSLYWTSEKKMAPSKEDEKHFGVLVQINVGPAYPNAPFIAGIAKERPDNDLISDKKR